MKCTHIAIALFVLVHSVHGHSKAQNVHHCLLWSDFSCEDTLCTRSCLASTQNVGNPVYYDKWLTSLTIVDGGSSDVYCPDGYTKDPTNLNEGATDDDYIYTCYKQGEPDVTPINDIQIITGMTADAGDCPTGYEFLDYDLNEGAAGKYMYYCYHRGSDKPINSIAYKVLDDPLDSSDYPNGTCRMDDLNDMAGGKYIYLCFTWDWDAISQIQLTDVVYDMDKISDNDTSLVSVATIHFNNTSDTEASADSITDTYVYTTSEYWETALAYGLGMQVEAGIPVFNQVWSISQTETYTTTSGSSISVDYQESYTLNCEAPPKTAMECSAAYTQGTVNIPYTATQTVHYVDGRAPVVTTVTDVYEGVSVSSLEIINKVVGNFTD